MSEEAALGSTRNDGELLATWLAAHGITDVILSHADQFPGHVLVELGARLQGAAVDLWLVVEPTLLDAVVRGLPGVDIPQVCQWSTFKALWPVSTPDSTTASIDESPAVSEEAVDIGGPEMAVVHAITVPFLVGFARIADGSASFTVVGRRTRGSANGAHLARTRVAACLRRLADEHRDPRCRAEALEGASLFLGSLGWTISLGRSVQRNNATGRASAVSERWIKNMLRFRDPEVGAAAALTCLDLAIDEIAKVKIVDLTADGSELSVGGEILPVQAPLRPMLRAQRIHRLRRGAESADVLLTGGTRGASPFRVALLAHVGLGLQKGSPEWRRIVTAPAADERWL